MIFLYLYDFHFIYTVTYSDNLYPHIATLEKLINTNRLSGNLSGGRQDTAQYIPDIYTRAQNDWVDSFYKQNGYLGEIFKQ